MKRHWMAVLGAVLLYLSAAIEATAAIPATLYDPANCRSPADTALMPFVMCDDGLPTNPSDPQPGGLNESTAGAGAVTVPARYQYPGGGSTFIGLPPSLNDAAAPGADAAGNIALDVDISLPTTAAPVGGYPLMFFMHGCCSGDKRSWESGDLFAATPAQPTFDDGREKWHYSNAWFASRGYVVVTYTARGFVNADNQGSTGETELDSRSFEGNDFQHLACQVLANAGNWSAATGKAVTINPSKVVLMGGSYGGGFAWLGVTDSRWTCNAETGAAGTQMRVAAAAPKYTWTDLLYSLVPTGRHLQKSSDPLPATDGCDSGPRRPDGTLCDPQRSPVGMPKTSINAALYASGKTGVPPGSAHTTFPPKIDDAVACLQGSYPAETNPACTLGANGTRPLEDTLPEFMRERSAYYQAEFWSNIAGDPSYRVPVFLAATFTDPLFPPSENRRMINRLRQVAPGYPIQAYYGDYQHFVQNKAKEWGDLCGADRHVCSNADFGGNFNATPASLVRTGVTTRINRFVDHYARPAANPLQTPPTFDVTAALQVCPESAAADGIDASEPGQQFTAGTFDGLATSAFRILVNDSRTTSSSVSGNPHAVSADPVGNLAANGGACPLGSDNPGAGVAVYNSGFLADDIVMIGAAQVTLNFTTTDVADSLQLNARLYDVFPDGTALMVDRGPRRVTAAEAAAGTVTWQLQSNGWRFPTGHRIRLEVAQDDNPYVKNSTPASSTTITQMTMDIPYRPAAGGGSRDIPAGRGVSGALTLGLLGGLFALAGLRRRRH